MDTNFIFERVPICCLFAYAINFASIGCLFAYAINFASIGCKFNLVPFATSEMGGEQKHGSTYKDHPIQVEIPLLPL